MDEERLARIEADVHALVELLEEFRPVLDQVRRWAKARAKAPTLRRTHGHPRNTPGG